MSGGIYGFIGLEDKILLQKMGRAIRHRGPKIHNYFSDAQISLGVRELPLYNLKRGDKQPIHNEDWSLWIVFDGKIYNSEELRMMLKKNGHKFYTKNDAEIILHSYEENKLHFLDSINGVFVFSIWDSNQKKLIFGRDRVGVKHLYYWKDREKLLFGSEIKALLISEFVSREINPFGLYNYFSFGCIPSPFTLFKKIYKVPPGCIVYVDRKRGKIKTMKYWDIVNYKFDIKIPENVAIKKIEKLLKDSINLRINLNHCANVSTGGGIDTTAVIAFMNESLNIPIKTFTFCTKDNSEDLKWARYVSEYYGTQHNEIYINEEDVIKTIPKLIEWEDDTIADPATVCMYFISDKVKKENGTTLWVGDGGDELFCGYPFYKFELLVHKIFKNKLLSYSVPFFITHFQSFLKNNVFIYFLRELVEWGKNNTPSHSCVTGLSRLEKMSLVSGKLKEYFQGQSSCNVIKNICGKSSYRSFNWLLFRERIAEFKFKLPEFHLVRNDRFNMRNSIDVETPFLDYKLIEWGMRIPPALHLKNGEYKFLLKKALVNRVPKLILKRKKSGFLDPIVNLPVRPLRKLALENLEDKEIRKIFNLNYVKKMIEGSGKFFQKEPKHLYFRIPTFFRLWILLNFILWYKYWILKKT